MLVEWNFVRVGNDLRQVSSAETRRIQVHHLSIAGAKIDLPVIRFPLVVWQDASAVDYPHSSLSFHRSSHLEKRFLFHLKKLFLAGKETAQFLGGHFPYPIGLRTRDVRSEEDVWERA